MAKRHIVPGDHPHLKTGAGMFPVQQAGPRKCYLCRRRRVNGPLIGDYTLCAQQHDTPMGRAIAIVAHRKSQEPRFSPRRRV